MKEEQALKCGSCSNLSLCAVGDRHTEGWLKPDPAGVLLNTMEMVQTSLICLHCGSRWKRTKMKLSGAVRWTESESVKDAKILKSAGNSQNSQH